MRLIVGAVLAGVALFVWGAVSHMLLPVGHMGLRSVPPEHEETVRSALVTALSERAIYFYPPLETENPTEEAERVHAEKAAAGPNALIAYVPGSGVTLGPRTLGTELGADVLACLLAGCILLLLPASVGYLGRALTVALMGAFAVLAIEVSYWNWYRFPTEYLAGQALDQVAGGLVAGLVLAGFCRPRAG